MINKILWNIILAVPVLLGAALAGVMPAIATEAQPIADSNGASNEAAVVASVEANEAQLQTPLTVEAPVQLASTPSNESIEGSAPDGTVMDQVEQYGLGGAGESMEQAPASQLEQYTLEGTGEPIDQVTSVSQLSDVQPTDWAFQATQSLVERYGCIAGYPDGTFRGNRALTRYEFAAGLNACLDRVNELIAAGLQDAVTREDLATLQRLQEEFSAELATIRGQVDSLEARTAELEANQFSTTTKLAGETIFAISDAFGGSNVDIDADGQSFEEENNATFQSRVRLNFDTSFVGTDRLRVRLQYGNFARFPGDPSGGETRLGFDTDTANNTIVVDDFNYQFNIGDRTRANVYANSGDLRDLIFGNVVSPFVASGRGAISRFGRFNPIYRIAGTGVGAALSYRFTNPVLTRDIFSVDLAYNAGEGNSPNNGAGLFNGNYGLLAQLNARSFLDGNLDLSLTYINSYTGTSGTGGTTAGIRGPGLGSILSRVDADVPVAVNSYGVEVNYKFSPSFQIGGWAGFSAVRAIGLGDADVWNYAVTLAFPDLGGEGNLGGIVVGIQPRLTGATPLLGAALGIPAGEFRSDPDVGLHVEGFYRINIAGNIDITPGVIWLTAPNQDNDNDDIIVGTIRTTFSF